VIHQRWSCCQCHIMDVEAIKTGKQGPSDTSNLFIVRGGHAISCCRHNCNYTAPLGDVPMRVLSVWYTPGS
jgi:hypothetical protein